MESDNINERTGNRGLAITSLVLGVVSIPVGFVVVGSVLGILAIIFGAVAKHGRRLAIVGIVSGIIGIGVSVWMLTEMSISMNNTQQTQRDIYRQDDVFGLRQNVESYMADNNGNLPSLNTLSADLSNDPSQAGFVPEITSIVQSGKPTTSTALYRTGTNCDGITSSDAYSITIMKETGSKYCLGS